MNYLWEEKSGHSRCKGPEVGTSSLCLKNSKEANGLERRNRGCVQRSSRSRSRGVFKAMSRILGFRFYSGWAKRPSEAGELGNDVS